MDRDMKLHTARNGPSNYNNDLVKLTPKAQLNPPKSLFTQDLSQKVKEKL